MLNEARTGEQLIWWILGWLFIPAITLCYYLLTRFEQSTLATWFAWMVAVAFVIGAMA